MINAPMFVGLDFGTTNSAIAIARAGEAPALAGFADGNATTETFRSILFFDAEATPGTPPVAGPAAIHRFLEAGSNGRLIQSLKSFLADRLFQTTNIVGDTYRLEDLAGFILV